LILLENGILLGFGVNSHGQLGIGSIKNQSSIIQINFFKDLKIDQITCGYQHSIVLCEGEVYCFGRNEAGQLGLGNKNLINFPTKLLPLSNKILHLFSQNITPPILLQQTPDQNQPVFPFTELSQIIDENSTEIIQLLPFGIIDENKTEEIQLTLPQIIPVIEKKRNQNSRRSRYDCCWVN